LGKALASNQLQATSKGKGGLAGMSQLDMENANPCRSRQRLRRQGPRQSNLCSMAYFTNSASDVMLSFCINRALWVLMVLLLRAS
jgi:hypothetical protein